MKIPALLATLALASGFAFAQAPNDTAKAPAAGVAPAATSDAKPMKAAKKAKKAKKAIKKADAGTQTMGAPAASAASPQTDTSAAARKGRIDEAYANWKSGKK